MEPSMIVRHHICHTSIPPHGLPVGSVIAVIGPMTELTYFPCDGRLVEKEKYQELFAMIGHAYRISWVAPETWWQRLWRRLRGRPQKMIYEQLPEGTFRLPIISIP